MPTAEYTPGTPEWIARRAALRAAQEQAAAASADVIATATPEAGQRQNVAAGAFSVPQLVTFTLETATVIHLIAYTELLRVSGTGLGVAALRLDGVTLRTRNSDGEAEVASGAAGAAARPVALDGTAHSLAADTSGLTTGAFHRGARGTGSHYHLDAGEHTFEFIGRTTVADGPLEAQGTLFVVTGRAAVA